MTRPLALAFVFVLVLLGSAIARGDEAGQATRQILESGRTEAGEAAMSARVAADPANNEARFGLGMIRFALALERFGKRQYRYGARAPHLPIPLFRLPLPSNPRPEAVRYEDQRQSLQALLDDLDRAEAALAGMNDANAEVTIDLNAVKFDFRGDGKPDASETLGQILLGLQHRAGASASFEVKFDNGDAFWLRGYCHLLSAALQFVLAYDWRVTFERAGGLVYPRTDPPEFAGQPELFPSNMLGDDGELADVIVWLHEIRWPLSEPARLQSAHAHLKQVVAMSRKSWNAILAETDDDHEWIPGPKQKNGVIVSMPVSQEQVDAWLRALDDFDAVLDGTELLPHWRFKQGFNLKQVFFAPRDFDLVLWASGHAAVPFLQDGPVLSWKEWNAWNQAFHDNFLGYAFWFN